MADPLCHLDSHSGFLDLGAVVKFTLLPCKVVLGYLDIVRAVVQQCP